MEKIRLICVGKLKEAYWRDAEAEYLKRLKAYAACFVTVVKDEKTVEKATEAEDRLIKEKEGERIRAALDDKAYTVAMDIRGKAYDSEGFAAFMEETAARHDGRIQFVIGGSTGICDAILESADARISFSKMTFPHQMMRVILLEQIYRSYRIRHNAPYHK